MKGWKTYEYDDTPFENTPLSFTGNKHSVGAWVYGTDCEPAGL